MLMRRGGHSLIKKKEAAMRAARVVRDGRRVRAGALVRGGLLVIYQCECVRECARVCAKW